MPIFLTKLTYNVGVKLIVMGVKLIVMVTIVFELPSLVIAVIKEPFPIITLSIAISRLGVAKTCASLIHNDI